MPINYLKNIPLAPYTTFQVGGPAQSFLEAKDVPTITSVFRQNSPDSVFVLGGGSNVLISDDGFQGLVLRIGTKGVEFEQAGNDLVRVTANAGEDWDRFVAECVSRDLAGLECLSGIPGLVGGTPIQNVGAYGQEVSESIEKVVALDRETAETVVFSNSECGFEYRKSIFNGVEKDRFVVLSVTFVLKHEGAPKVVYRDLINRFDGAKPGIEAVRSAVCEIRRSKGMLVRQGGPDSQSAGSFFKNPVVDRTKLEEIAGASGIKPEEVPFFEVGPGSYKVPAAWLIENSGFSKGFVLGNAGISEVHALALTNRGGATAKEIMELKEVVEEGVEKKFGLRLVNEPNLIGF